MLFPKETIQWCKSCARCFYGFPGEIWQISHVIFTSFFYIRPEKISIKELFFFSSYIIGISMQKGKFFWMVQFESTDINTTSWIFCFLIKIHFSD